MFWQKQFRPYQYLKTYPLTASQKLMRGVGYGSILSFFVGLWILFSPIMLAESIGFLLNVQKKMNAMAWFPQTQDKPIVVISQPIPTPYVDPASLPFSIQIPKINVDSKVIPNISTGDEEAYKIALKEGVAHGFGSSFPGQGKMIYIFGHSTDYPWNVQTYNALFYQIKDLVAGDDIYLTHGDKTYHYQMIEQKILEATDITYVNQKVDEDILILQTCWPPGTSWKRLLVIAKPVK